MTADPLAFLTAALDAAQRDAEAATAGPWYVTPREYDEDFEASIGSYPEGADIAGHGYEGGGVDTLATATHITRHDPQATLRRIAADRKLIAEYEKARAEFKPDDRPWDSESGADLARTRTLQDAVRLLAEGYGWTETEQR